MNRKTLYILVAVLVVVIVAAVAGVLLLNTQPVSVANATSLEFTVNVTTQGTTTTLAFYGKNIGTSNLTIRLDILGGESGNWSYILDTGQEKSWNSTNNGAWESSNFTADWDFWGNSWTNLVTNLKNWSGAGDYSYTSSNGDFHTIYNITVNPKLSDSLFQAS
jgi:type II secretory pathway pseudopilin PulG